jgi:hypothetical protein
MPRYPFTILDGHAANEAVRHARIGERPRLSWHLFLSLPLLSLALELINRAVANPILALLRRPIQITRAIAGQPTILPRNSSLSCPACR